MAVLVIAEHNHAALNPAVYSLVTAAQKIGGDIDIVHDAGGTRVTLELPLG